MPCALRPAPDAEEVAAQLRGVGGRAAALGALRLARWRTAGEPTLSSVYVEGISAIFESGPRFVGWTDILTYTCVPVPGASFHLHTATVHLKMNDPRMRDVGRLLDFIYGREELPEA